MAFAVVCGHRAVECGHVSETRGSGGLSIFGPGWGWAVGVCVCVGGINKRFGSRYNVNPSAGGAEVSTKKKGAVKQIMQNGGRVYRGWGVVGGVVRWACSGPGGEQRDPVQLAASTSAKKGSWSGCCAGAVVALSPATHAPISSHSR